MYYDEEVKGDILRTLQIKPFFLPSFTVFVRNRYAQLVGAEYLDHYDICYHIALILGRIEILEAIEFSFSASHFLGNT